MGHKPRRIDYVFVPRDGVLKPLSAAVVFNQPAADGAWPSDHFGVVARLQLKK
jgi:endonuclease/exonuclease/phosphatase family metal-dependent hydrolase